LIASALSSLSLPAAWLIGADRIFWRLLLERFMSDGTGTSWMILSTRSTFLGTFNSAAAWAARR